YVMLPIIGLAMLGGWALASAPKAAATALLLIYLSPLPATWAETKSSYRLTRKIERVVMGVEEGRRLHPDQIILLTGVTDDLFWNGILDSPVGLVGVSDVYLAPEEESKLTPHPALGNVSPFVLPASATLEAINSGRIVVYSAAGERLKNITGSYASTAQLHLS